MPRSNNYPDNIRDFDHDSRSPFFTPPDVQCSECGSYKPEDEVFGLYEGDEERKLCSNDCNEAYCTNNADELVVELLDYVDTLQTRVSVARRLFESSVMLAEKAINTAGLLKRWRKDSPEHDEAVMHLLKHRKSLDEIKHERAKRKL